MGLSSVPESIGSGFDSKLVQVTFGPLFAHVCGHGSLAFWGREQTISGIDATIGNFTPKSILWEWF